MNPRDAFQLLLLGALWGASFLFMRVAVPEFSPIPLIAIRVGVAAIVLSACVFARGGFATIRDNFAALTFVGAINSAIPFCLFAYATVSLTAGFASVLNATVPLFGAIVAFFWLRERLPTSKILGLLVGFTGVVILVWQKLSFSAEGMAIGAGLAAAILYAFAAHYSRKRLVGVDPLVISAGSLLGSCLLLVVPAALTWPDTNPSLRAWVSSIVLGVGCTALAYLYYFRLIQSLGATRTTTVTYLIPAFGIVWGAIFLGEPITLDMIAGGLVIMVGTTLVARGTQKSASPTTPSSKLSPSTQ